MSDSSNSSRWQKGQSGNPKGRPHGTERTLASILRETGEHDSFADLPNKNLMAQTIWRAVAFGEVRLLNGKTYELSLKEWVDLVKWLNHHVDGSYSVQGKEPPPPPPIDENKFFNDPNFKGSGVYRRVNAKGAVNYDDRSLYLLKQDGFIHRSELETGEPFITLIDTVPVPDSVPDDSEDNPA